MDWFRMYAEFATDPKVQMLSEADQRRYIMLLCLRCCNGDVTLQDDEVAFQLRISNEEWAETKAILQDKGLIDEQSMPTAWDRRQYVSDSSAARVAAHRARKKQRCNVTVTPPDTDTDKKHIPPLPPAGGDRTASSSAVSCSDQPTAIAPEAKPKPKTRRGTRLPDPFLLTTDMARWARDRAPGVNLSLATEKFVNYWRGTGKTKVDWEATWRNWILGEIERLPHRHSAPPDFHSGDTSWADDLGEL